MEEKKTGNVTKIEEGRKKKKLKEEKLKAAEIYRAISDAVKHEPFSMLPPFPRRYIVTEPEPGARVLMRVSDDDSVTVVRTAALANDILVYTERELGGRPDFCITPRQAKEIAEYYEMTAPPRPPGSIALLRWQGEEGLTFRRLPWALQEAATGLEAPTWEALLSRMSNAAAFIEWIGSLFFEESYLQNYVWLFGRLGGDGKGAINRFLEKVFGSSYRSKQPPASGMARDKFWTHGLLGARLVVFPDCDDPTFVTKGLFMSLTGGDPIDVEPKWQMSYTARLIAKFMIISNDWPDLTLSPAHLRRIIYCELSGAPSIDPHFEAKLWDEGGAFLSICVERYRTAYPHHGPIRSEVEGIESLASATEEDYTEVFESWFAVDPDAYVEGSYMLDLVRAEWPRDLKIQGLFRKWLGKRHGVKRKKIRVNEKTPWVYMGIKLLRIPPHRDRHGEGFQK